MQLTDYHAKYFAYELTKRCAPDSMEKLASAVAGAQVDLNPHQVDAALFAFNSPLSKGALLADEVGLGKTIEAGLVLSQKWAERKRCILIITPSNLRKQWHQELSEKFFLPCEILESKPYNTAVKTGNFKPFEMRDIIVICSYQFACNKAVDVANTPWDLVVIDEAHRLRNVYKPSNVIANTLKQALKDRHKLLLTATPLQNSLLATAIDHNAKGKALIKALAVAFDKAKELGAAQKAIVFTESRRTQSYLLRVLADSQFSEGIVLFNGSNTDDRSKQIYAAWLERHQGTDRISDSKSADMRSALVDYFREEGRIMIATEAGAEGINLQFCSLVVNYDLPWNPQRIEQRIGRCHRYGQKHDVVVVNFLNRKNEADRRVFELLSEKFKLFDGVFGTSDEVLGAIESGVDFEKRIASIYQRCRKTEEIRSAFDQLQLELNFEINEAMSQTRRKLLENFDDEVREKLKVRDEDSRAALSRFEHLLMRLTRHELELHAEFINDSSFRLRESPDPDKATDIPAGLYELPRRSGEAHTYRLNHPLAELVMNRAKERELPSAEVHFNYADHEGKVSILEPFVGQSGELALSVLSVEALDHAEDHLIFAVVTDDGQSLDDEAAMRLMSLPGKVNAATSNGSHPELESITHRRQAEIQREISERNAHFFEAEVGKLEGWADDLKLGLEREIKELDRQIKEFRRGATSALTLEDKLAGQKKIKELEAQRNQKRRTLFEAQDQVDKQRDELISSIEGKLVQSIQLNALYKIKWLLR